MSVLLDIPSLTARPRSTEIPPLENGDQLSATEFLRRFEAMPDLKKAELIQGEVYVMSSPVRIDQHSDPDSFIQGWLFTFAAHTPGVKSTTNGTTRLSPDDVPQPDASLRLTPECGGNACIGADGYLRGAPELVVEIAASSASIDVRKKRETYRLAGVCEYIVWRTRDAAVDWWVLEEDEYRPLLPDSDGIFRSHVFPGLWLDATALIAENAAGILAVCQQGIASEEHVAFVAKLQG